MYSTGETPTHINTCCVQADPSKKQKKISNHPDRRNQESRLLHFHHYNNGCWTWLCCTSPMEAHGKTPFSSFPLWPGNYPNLPSSWAPAPVLRPPLWLHYQRWSSLMAQWLHCAGRAGGDRLGGRLRKKKERKKEKQGAGEEGGGGVPILIIKKQNVPWRFTSSS